MIIKTQLSKINLVIVDKNNYLLMNLLMKINRQFKKRLT